MQEIRKRYVVDEHDRRVAVQIDLETFEKIEGILEDYALGQLMLEETEEEPLDLEAARRFYGELPKAE